jgi:hypothetical protein
VTGKYWLCLALVSACGVACTNKNIPNTRVPDTQENREVLDFVEKYRKAIEARDVASLLGMASVNYFDDMGTAAGEDDIDYDGLREGLKRLRSDVLAARYQISYRGLSQASDERVWVDLLYTGWFKITTQDGPQWRRRLEPHRIVLTREDNRLKIISGM